MKSLLATFAIGLLAIGLLLDLHWLYAQEPLPKTELKQPANSIQEIIAHRGSSSDRPENTTTSAQRAVEAGATAIEIDIRTTADGHLVLMHDASVERTTNGIGLVSSLTLKQIKSLDAGSKFSPLYQGEPVATLDELLQISVDKNIQLLLDLKESGEPYAQAVAAAVQRHANGQRVIVGVRSVEQAVQFRKLLPESRQLGFIPKPESVESFAAAGVDMIRLWSDWLPDDSLVKRVRAVEVDLQINVDQGSLAEVEPLLGYQPEAILCDNPALLVETLAGLNAKPVGKQ
jgi:glycerophosphoryl diester phosphodiesterase